MVMDVNCFRLQFEQHSVAAGLAWRESSSLYASHIVPLMFVTRVVDDGVDSRYRNSFARFECHRRTPPFNLLESMTSGP